MDDATVDRIMERLRLLLKAGRGSDKEIRTIDDIEEAALRLRDEAGQIAAEELTAHSLEAQEPEVNKVECSCGRNARCKGRRSKSFVSLVGIVNVRRRYYYCRRCDRGFCPSDASIGFESGGYTKRVQQRTVRLCTNNTYEESVCLLADLCGVHVSVSHAQRMVVCAGDVAANLLAERMRIADEADRERSRAWSDEAPARRTKTLSHLYVEMDGVQTPLLGGYNEMKVGVCFGIKLNGKRTAKQYVSHLGSVHDFAPHLYALSMQAGLEEARKVVVLGDGSPWIWNVADQDYPDAIQILDIWHVMDRLAKVARSGLTDDATKVPLWLEDRHEELLDSNLEGVRCALRALATQSPTCADAVESEIGYINNNASRMDYKAYLEAGLCIGSGVAESGCKRVVTQRLKGAGMRWTHEGAATMAALRCFVLSGNWDHVVKAWNTRTSKQAMAVAV